MFGALQFELLREDLGFDTQCLSIDGIRSHDRPCADGVEFLLSGSQDGEAIRRRELEQLCQCQDSQTVIVVCLGSSQTTIGEGGLLLREFGLCCLAVLDEGLQTGHLCRVDVDLTTCHIGQFYIVEYLHVSLSHLHTDIVLGLLQVGCSGLQVQFGQLDLVGNLKTSEERYAGADTKRRVAGIGVGIGVRSRQTTSEREVLTYVTTEIRETGILGRRDFQLLLTAEVLLLLDADVMLDGIVAAFAQTPLLLLG